MANGYFGSMFPPLGSTMGRVMRPMGQYQPPNKMAIIAAGLQDLGLAIQGKPGKYVDNLRYTDALARHNEIERERLRRKESQDEYLFRSRVREDQWKQEERRKEQAALVEQGEILAGRGAPFGPPAPVAPVDPVLRAPGGVELITDPETEQMFWENQAGQRTPVAQEELTEGPPRVAVEDSETGEVFWRTPSGERQEMAPEDRAAYYANVGKAPPSRSVPQVQVDDLRNRALAQKAAGDAAMVQYQQFLQAKDPVGATDAQQRAQRAYAEERALREEARKATEFAERGKTEGYSLGRITWLTPEGERITTTVDPRERDVTKRYTRVDTGEFFQVPPGSETVGDVKPATPTMFQERAAGFLDRMTLSAPRIDAFEGREDRPAGGGAQGLMNYMASDLSERGGLFSAFNYVVDPEYQAYLSDAGNWISGVLRYDSGAAVPDTEFRRYYKTYFEMPGDSPATLAVKRTNRRAAEQAVRRGAGVAVVRQLQADHEDDVPPQTLRDVMGTGIPNLEVEERKHTGDFFPWE